MWDNIAQGSYHELCALTFIVSNTSRSFPAISAQRIDLPSYPTYNSWITQMHIQWCYSLVAVTVPCLPHQKSPLFQCLCNCLYISMLHSMPKTIHLQRYRGVLCLSFGICPAQIQLNLKEIYRIAGKFSRVFNLAFWFNWVPMALLKYLRREGPVCECGTLSKETEEVHKCVRPLEPNSKNVKANQKHGA